MGMNCCICPADVHRSIQQLEDELAHLFDVPNSIRYQQHEDERNYSPRFQPRTRPLTRARQQRMVHLSPLLVRHQSFRHLHWLPLGEDLISSFPLNLLCRVTPSSRSPQTQHELPHTTDCSVPHAQITSSALSVIILHCSFFTRAHFQNHLLSRVHERGCKRCWLHGCMGV
jgi:hypothetical protein